jgi:hypothetical protein
MNKNYLRSSAFIGGSIPFIFSSVVSVVSVVPSWFNPSPPFLGALGVLGG